MIREAKVNDKVFIVRMGETGPETLAQGVITNINDFREPSKRYAVELDMTQKTHEMFKYFNDLLFVGDDDIVIIEED